jgi:galactose mutarotase-like enzyme
MSPNLDLGLPDLKATIERVIWFHFSKNTGPPGKDYFCAEPVSNCTDAFNLAHERYDTGMIVIAPGQTVSARAALHSEARG